MGDYFEIIADVDATEAEAAVLAESIVRWMVGEGIIVDDATDCVLGAESGYAPGSRYTAAVTEPDDHLHRRLINGVEVSTGRSVFHPMQGKPGPVICPRCDQTVLLADPATGKSTDQWELFSDALDAWYADGSSQVPCMHCRQLVDFNDWQWVDEWRFAIGFLGFTFWNWPTLSAAFIAEVAERLGHRVVVTKGKL